MEMLSSASVVTLLPSASDKEPISPCFLLPIGKCICRSMEKLEKTWIKQCTNSLKLTSKCTGFKNLVLYSMTKRFNSIPVNCNVKWFYFKREKELLTSRNWNFLRRFLYHPNLTNTRLVYSIYGTLLLIYTDKWHGTLIFTQL